MSVTRTKKGLAPGDKDAAQIVPTPHSVAETPRDDSDIQSRQTLVPGFRAEYVPFASALRYAMLKNKLSASEVARRIWGSGTDSRGYSVARNRDRIGHYLAGASYPEPENLVKLAAAVGVSVDDLTIEKRPAPLARIPRGVAQPEPVELQLTSVPGTPGKARLQLDRIMDFETALRIIQLIKEDERRPAQMPPTGRSFGKPEPELRSPAGAAPVNAAA